MSSNHVCKAVIKEISVIDLSEDKVEDIKEHKVEMDLSLFEDLLACGICQERMKKPVTLSECGHSFCRQCIIQWFARLKGDTTSIDLTDDFSGGPWIALTCPTCRAFVHRRPNKAFIIDRMATIIDEAVRKFRGTSRIVVEGVNENLLWDKYFGPDMTQ